MPDNNYPPKMPPAVKASIEAKLDQIEQEAAPYGWSLTDKERKGGLKMGAESIDFVQSARDAAQAHPDVMPGRFKLADLVDTYEGNRALEPIVARLESLARKMSDAAMRQGSVAYGESLEVYDQFGKEKGSDSALIAFWNQMAERFAKLRGKRDKPID